MKTKRLISSRTPIKIGVQVEDFLPAILLPSKLTVIKIEVRTKSIESKYQGNPLEDFQAKSTASRD